MSDPTPFSIANEGHLHAALKQWLAEPGDQFEQPVGGYVIDIVRGERLIEIQTAHFGALRAKLDRLTAQHPVTLVHPIAQSTWIVKQDAAGRALGRRKSPRRGDIVHLFRELVHAPRLLGRPGFALEVLLVDVEEIWQQGAARNWRRRGWGVRERRLLAVHDRRRFDGPADVATLLPPLPEPFTTAELAQALGQPVAPARQMAYCLRQLGLLTAVGKRGRAVLYVSAGSAEGAGETLDKA